MLETILLPGTGRTTTRLGFGCSGLMGGLSERESLRLLEVAYEAGIRHFDVAPSYGHGLAERCLGKFLRGKRDHVTVATKYGILPPRRAWLGFARTVIRPLALRVPAARHLVGRAAAGLKTGAKFRAREARSSLENSLRELGLDRIDLWLLHEATAGDLDGSDLLPALRSFKQDGSIGAYGIGTERGKLDALWQRHPEYCRVLQYEWSAFAPEAAHPGAFCIRHRAISGAYRQMSALLVRDYDGLRQLSAELDADLAGPEILTAMLPAAALAANPDGMVLFSSRVPAHIRANTDFAKDPGNRLRALRLRDWIINASSSLPPSNY